MGANESTVIDVRYSQPNRFYFADEPISGNVLFENSKENLKLDEIFLELIGEVQYTTERTRNVSLDDGGSQTEIYREDMKQSFFTHRVSLVKPNPGESHLIIDRGEYSWPFQFRLTDRLPPNIASNTKQNPSISYYTRFVLDKPWYKSNTEQIFPLTICPRVNLLTMSEAQQSSQLNHHSRNGLDLKGSIIHGGIVPGKSIDLELCLQNPNQSKIKCIEVVFIQCRQVNEDFARRIIFKKNLDGLDNFSETVLNKNFHLALPSTYLAPTYTLQTSSFYVSIHYELILEVIACGVFTDFQTCARVIVGTDPVPDRQHQLQSQELDYFESS